MIRRPPRSTLFPTRRSSDLRHVTELEKLANQRMEALVNALLRGKQARNEAGVPYTIGIRPDEVNPGELWRNSLPHVLSLCFREHLLCVNSEARDARFSRHHSTGPVDSLRNRPHVTIAPDRL